MPLFVLHQLLANNCINKSNGSFALLVWWQVYYIYCHTTRFCFPRETVCRWFYWRIRQWRGRIGRQAGGRLRKKKESFGRRFHLLDSYTRWWPESFHFIHPARSGTGTAKSDSGSITFQQGNDIKILRKWGMQFEGHRIDGNWPGSWFDGWILKGVYFHGEKSRLLENSE